jgi:hypothetical protein
MNENSKPKALLSKEEMNANFNHLMSILETALTLGQLKKAWYIKRDLERETEERMGEKCYVINWSQANEFTETYNSYKFGKFGREVEEQFKISDAIAIKIEEMIYKAKTHNDLKEVNKQVYTDKKIMNDAKGYLNRISIKAYQEISERMKKEEESKAA